MKILVAGLVKNIQLQRLQEEGKKLGIDVDGCYASDLIIHTTQTEITAQLKDGRLLTDYDLIYLVVGKRRWEWYVGCLWANKTKGTKIVNDKVIDPTYYYFTTPASAYYLQIQNNLPFPTSTIGFKADTIEGILKNYTYPVIIKPTNGRQGRGVYKPNNLDEAKKAVAEILEKSVAFVVREFIPNDGDVRVFTVGYKAIGAMKRTPKDGEFRSNISVGATGDIFDLDKYPEVKEIAEKASEAIRTEVAGVDIMMNRETGKPYILEVNPAPQFKGFEEFTGTNAAEAIIKYFTQKIGQK